jgi:hypothetical protein
MERKRSTMFQLEGNIGVQMPSCRQGNSRCQLESRRRDGSNLRRIKSCCSKTTWHRITHWSRTSSVGTKLEPAWTQWGWHGLQNRIATLTKKASDSRRRYSRDVTAHCPDVSSATENWADQNAPNPGQCHPKDLAGRSHRNILASRRMQIPKRNVYLGKAR